MNVRGSVYVWKTKKVKKPASFYVKLQRVEVRPRVCVLCVMCFGRIAMTDSGSPIIIDDDDDDDDDVVVVVVVVVVLVVAAAAAVAVAS